MSTGDTVSDTGPIIALTLIGRVDLLSLLFTHVVVPRAVRRELIRVAPPE